MTDLMNNEYKLYELIKNNEDFSATDNEVAKIINVCPSSVAKYRYKLKNKGYIDYKIAFKDNRMRTFYKLTDKVYTGKLDW